MLTASKEEVAAVESQLKIIIRPLWSIPPIHGARITTKILNNPQLCEEWQIELKKMADQVNEMRETFAVELKSAGLLVGSLYQQFILHTLMYIVYACKSVK